MASLIPGYEYDIFISYRQKDNKGERWVSEFVEALKDEIESTFKEDISIYFDMNPHNGLLETHNVDKSLEDKLKCLIFIPIISQTYCDSECFAWQHEFVAFNKLAKGDQFGRDIRLSSGNVASRILPVKIHELDQEDTSLLLKELGGFLRSIEFIYKSSGVNRPLRANEESPQENLNKTYYRNQINKVANAIKEILAAIKKQDQPEAEISTKVIHPKAAPSKNLKAKILVASSLFLVISALGYFFFLKVSKYSRQADKSMAVLPFRNLSNDTSQTYFCDGFMDEILNNLQSVREFKVRSRTSTEQYRKTVKTPQTIGEEMNVNYLIEGSVGREDNKLKIWVKLINAKTDETIWTNEYVREQKQIFSLQSEIAKEIATELKTVLSPEEITQIDKKPTENLEAYNYYLLGNNYYWRSWEKQNIELAVKMYEKSIELDPNFALAYIRLAICDLNTYWFFYDHSLARLKKSKKAIDKAFEIDPNLPQVHLALGSYYYWGFLNYSKALEEIDIAEKMSKNNSEYPWTKGNIYRRAGNWTLATENFSKAIALDPGSPKIMYSLAETLSMLGEYAESEKYFKKAVLLNPTFPEVIWQKGLMYIKWKGNTIQARETIAEAYQISTSTSIPYLFELSVLVDIYDGKYQKALTDLSSKNIDIIFSQVHYNLKSLLYARVYQMMNQPAKAHEYYISARKTLEELIRKNPDDARLYSALGIAYGGLGLKTEAIRSGMKGVDLLPISKDAYFGVSRVEDLAKIYVMVGEYDKALEQIKLLLKIPSRISVKLLLFDPVWKPLWNLVEFKKIIGPASHNT